MSTRSRIGVQQANGKVKSIYCHWDGYPAHNGKILVENYNDLASAKALVKLGSLSALGEKRDPEPDTPHDFENKQEGVTVAYLRDRGEPLQIDTSDNADDMYRIACEGWEEYTYLFRDGAWYVTPVGGGAGPFLVTASDTEGTSPPDWKLVMDVLNPKIRHRTRKLALT